MSIEQPSPGKMKRRNPQRELLEVKAGAEDDTGSRCHVAWESQAGSNPCHSTNPCRARRSSKAARLWPTLIRALPQLMPGTGLTSPMTLADSPEAECTMSILSQRKGVLQCSELSPPFPLPSPISEERNQHGQSISNSPSYC